MTARSSSDLLHTPRRWAPLIAGALLAIVLSLLAARASSLDIVAQPSGLIAGQWVYLSDLQWEEATTGWLGIANEQVPCKDRAFRGSALTLSGERYGKGLGVYPLSEITYELGGRYLEFASVIGLDDAAAGSDAAVVFMVFVDDARLFQSDVMHAGDLPVEIRMPVAGAQTLRLVVDAAPRQTRNAFADWADARLLDPLSDVAATPPGALVDAYAQLASQRLEQRRHEEETLSAARSLASALPASLLTEHGPAERPSALAVAETGRVWLSSGRVAIGAGVYDGGYGRLTVLDLQRLRPAMMDAGASIVLGAQVYDLAAQTRLLGSPVIAPVSDAVLGVGTELILPMQTLDGRTRIDLHVRLYADDVVVLDVALPGWPDGERLPQVRWFSSASGGPSLAIGPDSQYISDLSRLRFGALHDDGITRRELLGQGKPLFIWSEENRSGLLLSFLEPTPTFPRFEAQAIPGQALARWSLSTEMVNDSGRARSARLYLEVTRSVDIRQAFAHLLRVWDSLYPTIDLPAWYRYQWLSWYAFRMATDDEALQRQADYIASNLSDLGPWHLLIDAGWYVSEGRPDADWRNVDKVKYPNGLRDLVNRVHDLGQRVVLYLSVPYIDSRHVEGDWLGLRDIIEKHPEWLRLLGDDEERQSYTFDFQLPEVRRYWSDVLEDFFVTYGVDGVKIDGIGNAEGAILSRSKVDRFGLVGEINDQTLAIYEFLYREATRRRADAYLETGWLTPTFSRPFVHTFRYGDEAMQFRSPYPFPGMVEHIDYAILQKQVLGLRANMGAIYDSPNSSALNRWWLEAALALGTHVTLGFDLTALDEETLSAYRSLLVNYEPFAGATTYGPGLRPDTFATTKNGFTYLAILNRERRSRSIAVPLADHGITGAQGAMAFDVEAGRVVRIGEPFVVEMPPESLRLFVVRQTPGVLWTNSSYQNDESAGVMNLVLRGPGGLPGYVSILCPHPYHVAFDGRVVLDAGSPSPGTAFSYDSDLGILSVQYTNDAAGHTLHIEYGPTVPKPRRRR